MSVLKTALKDGKALLGAGKYNEAYELLKPLLSQHDDSYMLLCFVALAESNTSRTTEARKHYENATVIDPTLPSAWQGLFKLYENGSVAADTIGVDVCLRYMELCDSKKKKKVKKVLRKLYLALGNYESLRDDLGEDNDIYIGIVEKLSNKGVLSTSEKELLAKSFTMLRDSLVNLPVCHLAYVKYLYSQGDQSWVNEMNTVCANGSLCPWTTLRVIELICQEFLKTLQVNENLMDKIVESEISSTPYKRAFSVLKSLRECDNVSAKESLDGMGIECFIYPISLLSASIYFSLENYDYTIKIIQKIAMTTLSTETVNVLNWIHIGSLLDKELQQQALEIFSLKQPDVVARFVRQHARLVVLQKGNQEDFLAKFSGNDAIRARIAWNLYSCDYSSSLEAVAQLTTLTTFDDLLLVALAKSAAGVDCLSILVKAAKMNSNSSLVFHLLGKCLKEKNPAKARGFFERAFKMRPDKEEYLKSLDDLLLKVEADDTLRLSYLTMFSQSIKPVWVKERLAKVNVALGNNENAVSYLQDIVRERPKDVYFRSLLADCYNRCGRLQASINTLKDVLELDPSPVRYISLIQNMLKLNQFDEVLEIYKTLPGCEDPIVKEALQILHALSHLRVAQSLVGTKTISHLYECLAILDSCFHKASTYNMCYKIAADSLILISRFNESSFDYTKIPNSWKCSTSLDCVQRAVSFYLYALSFNKRSVLSWSDLSCALIRLSFLTSSPEFSKKAIECLHRAIGLEQSITMKSTLWTRLAEAHRLSHGSVFLQQHCLVRALQLNKTNDEAWLRLGVLYLNLGESKLAHFAFETSLKYNPKSAEAWCAWAMKAENEGHHHEALDMYKHSMTLTPLSIALSKYTAYVCQSIRKESKMFDPTSVIIEFQQVIDTAPLLKSQSSVECLAVLTELFGNYEESVRLHKQAKTTDDSLIRAQLKNGESVKSNGSLKRLQTLAAKTSEELFQLLENHSDFYRSVFYLIKKCSENGDEDEWKIEEEETEKRLSSIELLKEAITNSSKRVNWSLIVAGCLFFDIKISDKVAFLIHDIRPRHELIDVFPIVFPEGLDANLEFLEKDGEEPFRLRHIIAARLFDKLQSARNERIL